MSVNIYNSSTGLLSPISGVPAAKLTALTNNQGSVEIETTATAAYEIGDLIVRSDDLLYEVITPVAIGDTWVNSGLNANIKIATLGDKITSGVSGLASNLANVELTDIATSAYTKGDYIRYIDGNGVPQFAIATAAIAINDAIVNGTNVTNTNIGNELTSLNSKFGLKEIHRTTNANQTYAVKLADLKTYFDALTTEEKLKAVIIQNDLSIYKVITLTGNFSYQGAATSTSSISAINLSNTTLVGWAYRTTGNTMSDYTNQSSTDVFVLYVIN